jgi:hypothetical protein
MTGVPQNEAAPALRELADFLRERDLSFLQRVGPDEVDAAEGYVNLMDLLSFGLDFYLHNDPERPHLCDMATPTKKFGGDNVDARYLFAPLRGDRSYRITGKRADECYLGFCLYAGAPGKLAERVAGNLSHPEMDFDAEGRFELILSPEAHRGNWLRMEPDVSSLIVRQYFFHAGTDRHAEVRIEPLEDPGPPPLLTNREVARRLSWVKDYIEGWSSLAPIPQPAEYNAICPPMRTTESQWATPDNIHAFGFFKLEPDEALLLEGRSPDCSYWAIQVWNAYLQSFDYRYHQVSLNKEQVQLEPDGSWRIAIAHRDPGLPNWISTAGHRIGFVYFRWQLSQLLPDAVTSRVIPAARAEV